MKENKIIEKITVKPYATITSIKDLKKPILENHNNGRYSITYSNGDFEYINERTLLAIKQALRESKWN